MSPPRVPEMKHVWVKTEWGMTPPIHCLNCGTQMVETYSTAVEGMKLYTCPACPPCQPEPDYDELKAANAELLGALKLAFENFSPYAQMTDWRAIKAVVGKYEVGG